MKALTTILASCFPLLAALHAEVLDGEATGELGISPASIDLSVRSSEAATVPIKLSNPLATEIEWRARLLAGDGGETDLAAVVTAFAGSGDALAGPIPNRLDSHNQVLINSGTPRPHTFTTPLGALPHTGGQVMESANLGPAGRYATLSLPGLFLFSADLDGVPSFQVDGRHSATAITRRVGSSVIEEGGRKWSAFIYKVRLRNSSSQLFTANQLILVDQPDAHQAFGNTLAHQLQRIGNLHGGRRLHYAFFATNTATLLDDGEILELGRRLIRTAPADLGKMIGLLPSSGTIGAGASSTLQVRANAIGAPTGSHSARIVIESTAGERLAEAPLTIDVRPPALETSLERLHVVSVRGGPRDLHEIAITAPGGGNPSWSAERVGGSAWLTVETPSGEAPGALAVRIDPTGLAEGFHHETVRIISGDSVIDVPVVLQIDPLEITQLRADPVRPRLYALNHATASGSMLVVSAADGSITRVVPVGLNPRDASFSTDGAFLYTADNDSRTITEIDLASLEKTRWREVDINTSTSRFNLAAGKNGIIYHTDSSIRPGLKVFHFESGTELASFQPTGSIFNTLGIDALCFDAMHDRLYGNTGINRIQNSTAFALDVSETIPRMLGISNEQGGHITSDGDTVLHLDLMGDRLFSMRAIFERPSLNHEGRRWISETRAITGYGHLRADVAGIVDTETNERIAVFPVGFPNAPRHSGFSAEQDALIYYNRVKQAFEILPVPEAHRPPRVEIAPSPPNGGILDPDIPVLSWTGLPFVEGYQLYIGTDPVAVAAAKPGSPEDHGVLKAHEFRMDPPPPIGSNFYWRVDGIRDGAAIAGEVHSARIEVFRILPWKAQWTLPQSTVPQRFHVAVLDENDHRLAWSATTETPWLALDKPSSAGSEGVAGMLDPSGLAPGIHTATLLIASGGKTRELELTVEILPLQLVKLAPDPQRPLVYGLHTGDPDSKESFLLAIDAATGSILKVLAVGMNATDFDVDPVAGRIYLNNHGTPLIRVVETEVFVHFAPLPATSDITTIRSDHAGRLIVQRRGYPPDVTHSRGFSILDAKTGAVLGGSSATNANGDAAAINPESGLYYIARMDWYIPMQVFDIHTDAPVHVRQIDHPEILASRPPLFSPDGSTLFWGNRSLDPFGNVIAVLPDLVLATNHDGEISVSQSAVRWSETGALAATLPMTTPLAAIDKDGRHLILFKPANGTLKSLDMDALVMLPGPQPKPAANVAAEEFDGLRWTPMPGALSHDVYFARSPSIVEAAVPGSAGHLGTVTNSRYDFESPLAWGHRYHWRVDTLTPSGTIKGEVREFDLAFPVLAESPPIAIGSWSLNIGAELIATGNNGYAINYDIAPEDGTPMFKQDLVADSFLYSDVATFGQGWILRALDIFSSHQGPPFVDLWSRDPFQGHWRNRHRLVLSPHALADSRVTSLASDGGHILAGIGHDLDSVPGQVATFIEWPRPRMTGSFQAGDASNGDQFGKAITMDGNRALVGAGGYRPGRAYLFEYDRDTDTWVQHAKMQSPKHHSNRAGESLALGGNHAVLGYGFEAIDVVHTFRNTRSGWVHSQDLPNPHQPPPGTSTRFGLAMAIHGDMLFVSQPNHAVIRPEQGLVHRHGLVHVYYLQNNLWVPGAPILGPRHAENFGWSLAVRDDVLYVASNDRIHSYRLRPKPNRAPRFDHPPPARLLAGRMAAIPISATDPDGPDGLVIRALALPPGMSLTDHGEGRAKLEGIPTSTAGSRIFVQWSVRDPRGATTIQSGLVDLIDVDDLPVFTVLPRSVNVGEGSPVRFTASADDDEPVAWQWFKDGVPIEGATHPFHPVGKATMADAGSYHVSATNEAGTSYSPTAILGVREPDHDGGPWSTLGNTAARSGHHPATLGHVTFVSAWTRVLGTSGTPEAPVIAENRVFTGIHNLQSSPLMALDLFTGDTLWSFPPAGNAGQELPSFNRWRSPSWFDGRIHLLAQDSGNSLHILDASTGDLLASSRAYASTGFPAVTDHGIFYSGLHSAEIDGVPRFRSSGGFPSVIDGRVFSFANGEITERRSIDGRVEWRWQLQPGSSSSGGIVALGEGCALVIHSGSLFCFDTETRDLRWQVEGGFNGRPATHNGIAYAMHWNGVRALSLADGTLVTDYPTPERPARLTTSGQQPILLNDHLIVSGDNATWIFRLADAELVQTIDAGGGHSAYSNGHLLMARSPGTYGANRTLRAFRAVPATEPSAESALGLTSGVEAPPIAGESAVVAGIHPGAPAHGLAIESCVLREDGTVAIDFTTRPGVLYEVQYSEDGKHWQTSPVRAQATGNRLQWIDDGPPRTATHPSENPSRFYRVRQVASEG